jgi:Leucine-rich repeat (LRR) protein
MCIDVIEDDADLLTQRSLTGVTSYSHLQNLENLDISDNEIESLSRKLELFGILFALS